MRAQAAAFLMAMSIHGNAQDPELGISRALAVERRQAIQALRYELALNCKAGGDSVSGNVRISFDLAVARPLVLDFAGTSVAELRVNGAATAARRVHDHLLIPELALRVGRNEITASFVAPVASTGTSLTVYRDARTGEEFVYTLLVPADAHGLFPCFDQPDLKARFALTLEVPAAWTAVANSPLASPLVETGDGRRFVFRDTDPLPTYLFAFAAGPFTVLPSPDERKPSMRLFVRNSRIDELDPRSLFAMHRRSAEWLGDYFARPYPFAKLDVVLLPAFPYGGMEHAGAIFYRENALVFDHVPTENELIRRSTLIYHEVSHQWFGNLVTMEWFDDLWLKEGFATYVAYAALEALEPEYNAWLRFHQRVKPDAYRIDITEGTTPIYQELDNLADAKSAYGAIVYNKAPAVLRELQGRLGERAFRAGMQVFLERHAWGNARWSDLVQSLEEASDSDLTEWSRRWILARGMPTVRARWRADGPARSPSSRSPSRPASALARGRCTCRFCCSLAMGRTSAWPSPPMAPRPTWPDCSAGRRRPACCSTPAMSHTAGSSPTARRRSCCSSGSRS
jgi:aminopeptidase N